MVKDTPLIPIVKPDLEGLFLLSIRASPVAALNWKQESPTLERKRWCRTLVIPSPHCVFYEDSVLATEMYSIIRSKSKKDYGIRSDDRVRNVWVLHM